VEEIGAGEPTVLRYAHDALAAQTRRLFLHLAAVARFSGEQRVATMLTELAFRARKPALGGGFALDMPLSRNDVGDYLGLSADTLSRIMSRLRAAGLLGHSERNRIIVRDA